MAPQYFLHENDGTYKVQYRALVTDADEITKAVKETEPNIIRSRYSEFLDADGKAQYLNTVNRLCTGEELPTAKLAVEAREQAREQWWNSDDDARAIIRSFGGVASIRPDAVEKLNGLVKKKIMRRLEDQKAQQQEERQGQRDAEADGCCGAAGMTAHRGGDGRFGW